MIRRRSCRLITAAMFVLLALYFLSTCFKLMLAPAHRNSKTAVNPGHLPWQSLNLSGMILARNEHLQIDKLESRAVVSGRNSTGGKPRGKNEGPAKPAHSSNSNNFRKVKVLCWIMTSPITLHTKAVHIKETWGPRCDVTLYMSSKTDPAFPSIALDVEEGRRNLWKKVKLAFKYVYDNHYKDADWFMKADDDTYVIVENLRYFLRDKNSSAPLYYGHNFKPFAEQGYMSGGAGYVLSKDALRRFVAADSQRCKGHYTAEDVGMGYCLEEVGVVAGDSRDSLNRSRFIPFKIEDFVNHRLPGWYHKYKKYDVIKGPGCCSDYLISCHYVPPRYMHFLDYAVYHLRSATNDGNHVYNIGNNRTVLI